MIDIISKEARVTESAGKAAGDGDLYTLEGPEAAVRPQSEIKRLHRVRSISNRGVKLPPLERVAQEQIVLLVQRLFLRPEWSVPHVIVFAGADRVTACGEICIRTGELLARQAAVSVCIVDANVHCPTLHELIGVERSPGLTDAVFNLTAPSTLAVQIAHEGLWFLPAGSSRSGVPGVLPCEPLQACLTHLREEFDYVLVNAPPLISSETAVVLGRLSDGMILVVEAHATRREVARVVKGTLENANVKLLGAVLNNRRFPIPDRIYRRL